MASKLHFLAGVAAVGIAGYALTMLLSGGDVVDEAEEAYLGADGQPVDARTQAQRQRERFAAAARGLDPRTRGHGALPDDADDVEPPPLVGEPGTPPTPQSARAGFDYAMRRVERLVERRRRLSVEQWQVLYREANDAYAALSIVLDASEPGQLQELETAHKRLQEGLAQVRVLGHKFQP